jgi:hypothetical protein
MAISIYSAYFLLYQLIPTLFAIIAGIFLILTERYNKSDLYYSKFYKLAGAILIISRSVLIFLIIFSVQFLGTQSLEAIAIDFLIYALIQHFSLLIVFLVCFSLIGVNNYKYYGNKLLFVAISGTIYVVLLLILDMVIFYWILGFVPLYIGFGVSLLALIMFILTFMLMVFIGFNVINKFFALAGLFFLLEYVFVSFILFLLI